MFPETTNKAFISAYRKGALSMVYGLSKSSNPYPDLRTRKGRVTFSRAFRRYWSDGYRDQSLRPTSGFRLGGKKRRRGNES